MNIFFLAIGTILSFILRAFTGNFFLQEKHNGEYEMPLYMPYNSKNAAYVYVQLGVKMLKTNMEESSRKRDYIHRYLHKHFQTSAVDFREHYLISLRQQHSWYDLADYLKKQLNTSEKRLQVVHFLCGLAFADGIMLSNERKFIDKFCEKMGLSHEEINAVVTHYFEKQQERDRKQREANNANYQSRYSTYTKESLKKKYATILDIPENSDLKKIKTAYRKLAKKWHPDLMINHSDAEKNYAKEKFLEIQEAYDFFCQ